MVCEDGTVGLQTGGPMLVLELRHTSNAGYWYAGEQALIALEWSQVEGLK